MNEPANFEHYFLHITKNCTKCLNCDDIIESKHRHDFVWCSCKSIAVDGGHAYLKRVGNYRNVQEMCENKRFSKEELQKYIHKYENNDTYNFGIIPAAKYFLNLWYPE